MSSKILAGQPEILRAAQRDTNIQKEIAEELTKLVSAFFGVSYLIQWKNYIEVSSRLLYQGLTTLQTVQTLGEEYTGIIQWTGHNNIPSLKVRTVMVLLNSLGENLCLRVIKKSEDELNSLPSDTALRPEAKARLLKSLSYLREALPFIIRLHQTLFYFQGTHYDISKRVTGIHHRLVRFWLRDLTVVPVFRVLGVISLLHLVISGVVALRQRKLQDKMDDMSQHKMAATAATSAHSCALCMGPRMNTTSTPCGHLFCWDCIIPWIHERPECPLCRQPVLPSRLILLRNFP